MIKDYQEEKMLSRQFSIEDYFPYLRKHISFLSFSNNNNIFDYPHTDYTFLSSLEFQNMVAFRRELMKDILFKTELEEVSKTIDRNIELTTRQGK